MRSVTTAGTRKIACIFKRVRSRFVDPAGGLMEASVARDLVAYARKLSELGLNPGRAGNLSARSGDGLLITPSGLPYDTLAQEDLVLMDRAGRAKGLHAPSSEWRLHRDIYAAHSDAHAIVHTHSPFATTLACLRRGIPAFHYEVAFAGGADIRCGDYATFGTQALSDACLAALEGRRACLLANHGTVACGRNVRAAVELAQKVEALAQIYWQALQVGEPALLDADEMARVADRLSHYGDDAHTQQR
jgi:L-fuculose-phosphate aldolase